jgi:ribosomal protein L7/L12
VEALRQARAAGHEVRLDDTFMHAVRANLRAVLTRYRRTAVQNPWRLDAGQPPVILGGTPGEIRSAVPTAAPIVDSDPAPAAPGSVLLRLREEAQRRAAVVTRRKATFEELYSAYEELRRDRHTRPADLAEAWADLCVSCGVTTFPKTPADLEWHEDELRCVLSVAAPSTFDLILSAVPPERKIAVIIAVREVIAGLGLAEAKHIVENPPYTVLESVPEDVAKAARRKLEKAGAKIELR